MQNTWSGADLEETMHPEEEHRAAEHCARTLAAVLNISPLNTTAQLTPSTVGATPSLDAAHRQAAFSKKYGTSMPLVGVEVGVVSFDV